MAKTIWREVTIIYTFWLLALIIMNSLMHGFVAVIWPLSILAGIWVFNLALWLWTNRT